MNKSSKRVHIKILVFIVFYSIIRVQLYAVSPIFEPNGITLFRKAYPEVVFSTKYDKNIADWQIMVTVGSRSAELYWAKGRMLPKEKLEHMEEYSQLLYPYAEKVPDPKNFTKKDIERIRAYSSEENRQNGSETPMFFYNVLYDCETQGDVETHIARLTFLGKRVNLHENLRIPLAAVEREIMALAKKDEEVAEFVRKVAKTDGYYWRTIRDSGNISFHSIGIAIDILPDGWGKKNIYWGWRRDMDPDNWMMLSLDRRWMPPEKVIKIFEQHGFIWGGKWIIWDDMHFEYHPELILYQEYMNQIHFPFVD